MIKIINAVLAIIAGVGGGLALFWVLNFLVDRLTRKGLVRRRQCSEDRRARYASLTPDGEELVGEIFPIHAARIREACSGLTAAEQREATALLRTLGHAAAALPDPE